jgi:signal transduction histidine kinase
MLLHGRTGTGKKESVNINALCDEYFRIAYYGFRAKNNSFTASLISQFDESIGNINIISHDIGSVILNLINNAFYSVQQKNTNLTTDYRADVAIRTWKSENQVRITVYDNGMGIPNHIKEKVFQPFFTTKPTGAGTGLGLSLSYDIIVKGHGGSLELQTEEGKFTEFTVVLPLSEE